jgi:succinate-semialdehyde dehydrogenase/glutarate-semialdehyde dehydrogenase
MTTAFVSRNPFTENIIEEWPCASEAIIEATLASASAARGAWKAMSMEQRAVLFRKLADLIRANADELAAIATEEMGKLLSEAKAEVLKCTTICEFAATRAHGFLQPQQQEMDSGRTAIITHEAIGTVLGIFPWNFPYWQIVRSAIPVIASGNTMIVKPAPNTPRCALALQDLFQEAGFPKGVVQTIFANEEQIAAMIADARVSACTLTGSGKAGSIVGATAARVIKRSVLELGGSDPFIVLPDADLELAASKAINARFQNNGQSCIAAKRFIVHKDIAPDFLRMLTANVSALRMGDPGLPGTGIGPLARKDLRDLLHNQVQRSVSGGAKIEYQATDVPSAGFFYPPTILSHIPPSAPAATEELFGPVLSFFEVNSVDEAVETANATQFGLGATVWSGNAAEAREIAGRLQCGQVFINEVLRSNAALPFGGAKSSGYGREMGEAGFLEFTNIKVITY